MIRLLTIIILTLTIAGCMPPSDMSRVIDRQPADVRRVLDCQAGIVCYGWHNTNAAISCVLLQAKLYAEACR